MIHYTCDRCKRTIDPETELRYVVEIDIRAACCQDPSQSFHQESDEDEVDHLAELHDQLQRELNPDFDAPHSCADDEEFVDTTERFDLCPQCHEIFASNPLGRDVPVGLGFSNN
ncbi:hypothetical protein [Rhodopirellula sp. MGV]|uniref:hypothetical protein n=1 Tax=Rhodopirellula sp. MGV TaxID=2023130 RepID=UPI000B97273F|nr:hypothetical protein [Rhodopirellula sp. MGV]OYP37065.1 hypothetical protein CGZ80_06870 [Rhodopirellula sp. MGV]PNY36172.1 hypothetical protein C2E31_13710 [Rhodopirellula baltica]